MWLKEWLIKRRLLYLLKNRSKRNFITAYLNDDMMIFVRSGRWTDENFGVCLPKQDLKVLRCHLRDGTFLVYAGARSRLMKFLLKSRHKWGKAIRWHN